MDVRPQVEIALNEYGGEGTIIMAPPSARANVWMKNQIGPSVYESGGSMEKAKNVGTIEAVFILGHVRKAPFERDVDAFMDQCDALDEKEYGKGVELQAKMAEVVQNMKEVAPSPLGL